MPWNHIGLLPFCGTPVPVATHLPTEAAPSMSSRYTDVGTWPTGHTGACARAALAGVTSICVAATAFSTEPVQSAASKVTVPAPRALLVCPTSEVQAACSARPKVM